MRLQDDVMQGGNMEEGLSEGRKRLWVGKGIVGRRKVRWRISHVAGAILDPLHAGDRG